MTKRKLYKNQLGCQLGYQSKSHLEDEIEDLLWGQLGDQLWYQLWDQLEGQLWGQLKDLYLHREFYG